MRQSEPVSIAVSRRSALNLLVACLLGPGLALVPHAPAQAVAGCPALPAAQVVPGSGDVQVFAIQYFQRVPEMATYASIRQYLGCYFQAYVDPYRDPARPGLVVFNELTGLAFGLEGSRGAAARTFEKTPGATFFGQVANQPLGAAGGALGLVAAAYSAPIAYYAARYPDAYAADPLSFTFLAVTDTYVRAVVENFSSLARAHHVAVVAGALVPILNDPSSCAANGYPRRVACPGWRSSSDPAAVAALADPDLLPLYASGQLKSVYVAMTPRVENVALFFDPLGRLYDVQPKVNLTPIELQVGWTPAPPSTIHAVPLIDGQGRAVPGVRLGAAISLDAFEHADSSQPCRDPRSYVACLDSKGVNLLLQPEYNDGTAQCASWSDYSAPCRRQPVWQQVEWMFSSWYDIQARNASGAFLYPHFAYAVNPFMVGNLYDLTGDGQTAIFARSDPRAAPGAYVGDRDGSLYLAPSSLTPYPDSTVPDLALSSPRDVLSLYQIDGTQPGWLSVAPWVIAPTDVRYNPVLANGDPGSLETCEHGLVGGSGVGSGPCAENGYLAGAVIAELGLNLAAR